MEECKHRWGHIVPGVERCSDCGIYKDDLEETDEVKAKKDGSTSRPENLDKSSTTGR